MAGITSLKEEYGAIITPKELSEFLGLDQRTVIKYADKWGGIEVSPGKYRFFEKLIRRKINAKFNKEERSKTLEGSCHGKGEKNGKAFPGQLHGYETSSSAMGKRNKGANRAAIDRHGLFDNF